MLSLVLATVVAMAVAGVMVKLALLYSGSDLVRYISRLWGSSLGQTIGAFYVLLLVFDSARPLAGVGLIGNVAFGWWAVLTPPLIFIVAAMCVMLAGQGLQRVARISEFAVWAALLLFLVAVGSVFGRIDWANYRAFGSGGWGPVWLGMLPLLGRFSPAYLLFVLVPATKFTKGSIWIIILTIMATGLALGAGILPIGLYGAGVAAESFIPFEQLLTDHILALTTPVVGLWLLALAFQTGIGLMLIISLLSQSAGAKPQRFLTLAGAAVAWTALLFWTNAGGTSMFGEKVLPYLSVPAAIGVPLLLVLFPWFRKRWSKGV